MKRLTFALTTFAGPLAAHEGVHVHPHGHDLLGRGGAGAGCCDPCGGGDAPQVGVGLP